MGVVALVLGIVSLATCWITGWNVACIFMGIAGIVLAAVAKKKAQSGVATAGLVLSILATVFAVILSIACGGWYVCLATIGLASM